MLRFLLISLLLSLIACIATPRRAQAQARVTAMSCDYMKDPLGIESAHPRLSWQMADSRRGAHQTAYQVQAASTREALRAGKADLWDTGKVGSDRSVHVPYSGKPLATGLAAHWRVRIWDQDGRATAWSAPARWEMGLLQPGDWHAQWIGRQQKSERAPKETVSGVKWVWYPEGDPRTEAPKATRFFRHTLEAPQGKQIARAVIHVAVDNSARVWVNGQEAGAANGWPSFTTLEIGARLKPGRNVIAISAANTDGPAGVAAIVHIYFADGTDLRTATPAGWKSAQIGGSGWQQPGFDDSAWKPALVIATVGDAPWNTPAFAESSVGGPASLLHRGFTIHKPVRSARVYATALGSYRLHINGQRVGNDILTPDWTDYRKRVNYQTYDVTKLLQQGDNAIAAMLGDGWYASGLGWNLQRFAFGDPPIRMMVQMRITFADGTAQEIVSDRTWTTAESAIRRSEIYAGETYDARKEVAGWDRPGFDDRGWQAAGVFPVRNEAGIRPVVGGNSPRLEFPAAPEIVAQTSPTIQVTSEIKPVKITQPKPGIYVYDMGQNMVGWCRLRVSAPAGNTVRLRFAEILNPDGTIYTENLRRAEATDTYVCKGDGTEVWEPTFTYHGFRYVEVTGIPGKPTLAALTGRVFHTNTPVSGRFTSSSPMVNQLARNILWGQRGNQHSVPTDCPQRDERLGWMGDAGIFSRTACYNMEMAPFYAKWMRDVVDAQSVDGGFPDVAPRVIDPSDGAPAWGDCGVIVPYEVFRQYGDTAIIRENWGAMEKWVEYIHSANPEILWLRRRNNDFGDWVPANSETPKDVLATAMWAYDAQLMQRMAQAIGRDADARKYAELYRGIKDAFIKRYVKSDGTVGNGSQTCQALAIHMDLIPAGKQAAVARKLVEDIDKRGGHLSTGFVGTCYLMRALTGSGHNDVAYRLLLNTTFPSWGYMIGKGATTMWERWNGDTGDPAMNSFNHYAFGAVGEWLYRNVAGIETELGDGAGYRRMVIRPRPNKGLTSARGEYDSVYGRIVSEWEQESDGTFRLHVTVPANTAATVYVPASAPESVTESGAPASSASGVRFLRTEEGCAVYAVGAGDYRFQAR